MNSTINLHHSYLVKWGQPINSPNPHLLVFDRCLSLAWLKWLLFLENEVEDQWLQRSVCYSGLFLCYNDDSNCVSTRFMSSFACIQVGVTDFTACCGLNQTVCVWAILIHECFLEVTEGGHPCCDWVILTFGPWPARRFQKNILLPCQLTIGTQTQQWGLKQS